MLIGNKWRVLVLHDLMPDYFLLYTALEYKHLAGIANCWFFLIIGIRRYAFETAFLKLLTNWVL